MGTRTIAVPPVARGFSYGIQIKVTGADEALFPAGCQLRAEVRDFVEATEVAGALVTGAGIERIDDQTIEVRLSAAVTAKLGNTRAVFDLVRTDVSPDLWLGIFVQLPVTKPVTAPGEDA